jgi:hypothetical protein
MKTKFFDVILVAILLGTVVSGFAYSWQRTTGGGTVIGMSADGRVICVVPSAAVAASISTDSGVTWKYAASGPAGAAVNQGEVALSANGGKIYAVLASTSKDRGIFKSSDQGNNWTRTSFPSAKPLSNCPVACSADGSIVVTAAGIGPLYYSPDGGASCYTSSVPVANWQSIASSADGRRLVAFASNEAVYFSADFGATWSPTNLPPEPWTSACISGDGQWVGTASETNSYISSDSGVTWLTNNISGNDISCSADGTHWLIVGLQTCTSTDSGKTWQTNFDSGPPSNWNAGKMSADGAEVFVMIIGSGLWLGRETPSPQLNIREQGSTLALSWLLSSTNFALQQKSDFTGNNWTTIPISPALILTNLQQKITLPVAPGNAFFRLKAE